MENQLEETNFDLTNDLMQNPNPNGLNLQYGVQGVTMMNNPKNNHQKLIIQDSSNSFNSKDFGQIFVKNENRCYGSSGFKLTLTDPISQIQRSFILTSASSMIQISIGQNNQIQMEKAKAILFCQGQSAINEQVEKIYGQTFDIYPPYYSDYYIWSGNDIALVWLKEQEGIFDMSLLEEKYFFDQKTVEEIKPSIGENIRLYGYNLLNNDTKGNLYMEEGYIKKVQYLNNGNILIHHNVCLPEFIGAPVFLIRNSIEILIGVQAGIYYDSDSNISVATGLSKNIHEFIQSSFGRQIEAILSSNQFNITIKRKRFLQKNYTNQQKFQNLIDLSDLITKNNIVFEEIFLDLRLSQIKQIILENVHLHFLIWEFSLLPYNKQLMN